MYKKKDVPKPTPVECPDGSECPNRMECPLMHFADEPDDEWYNEGFEQGNNQGGNGKGRGNMCRDGTGCEKIGKGCYFNHPFQKECNKGSSCPFFK